MNFTTQLQQAQLQQLQQLLAGLLLQNEYRVSEM